MPNLSFYATPSNKHALGKALCSYDYKTKDAKGTGEHRVYVEIRDGSDTELHSIFTLLRHYGVQITSVIGLPLLIVRDGDKVVKYHSEHPIFQ